MKIRYWSKKMKIIDENKVVCYYHNDMDGIMSASIVKKIYPKTEFISCQYGENFNSFPNRIFDEDGLIIIVDFTFPKDIMEFLIKKAGLFYWIDHHKTAKEQMPELWESEDIEGLRETGKAACELTWEWFYPHEEMPETVKLVGDRDVWKFEYGDRTRAFHEAVSLDIKEPNTLFLTKNFLLVKNYLQEGYNILRKKRQQIRKSFENGKDIIFECYETRIINSDHNVSELGEYCYQDKQYPIALIWSVRGDKIIYSLRSNNVDVSEIAKKYGGGGHKYAAGFTTNLDFILNIIEGDD